MGVLRDKIWRDLWEHKGRTVQVVLIIAVGAFAIGMIIGTRAFMTAGIEQIWQSSSPAMIYLWTTPSVDDDTVIALQHLNGVTEVEGFLQTAIEWRLSPNDAWSTANLTARADYADQKLAKLHVLSGEWPHKKVLDMGQGADTRFGIQPGSQVYIRVADHEYTVQVGGLMYNPTVLPPSFGGTVQFYATREQFGNLTGDQNFNRILASATHYDLPWVTGIADKLQDKLEKQGVDSGGFAPSNGRVADPARHFAQDTLDGLFFIMGVIAVLALILGLFLVYNTVTALIQRQLNQIGILKAIGARTSIIIFVYMTIVFTYGLLALALAIPLGALAARGLGTVLLSAFSTEATFHLSPFAILAQGVIALFAPLLACLVPIFTGARITVREAISSYGLNATPTLLDRLLAQIRGLPELFTLTMSNTFRHKQRVLLTQITLVLSGLIFMAIMSARDAAYYTFGDLLFSILRFDINFRLENPERIQRVEALTAQQPGIKAVEMWALENATIRLAGRPASKADQTAALFGVPLPTALYGPQLRVGRWLQPDDEHAVVLNQKLAADMGVGVGDTVTFKYGVKGESSWLVVGLIFDPVITHSAHVPRDVLLRDLHQVDRASTIWIQTDRTDAASEIALARTLREDYQHHKLRLNAASIFNQDTASQIIASVLGQFTVLIALLATMAVVIGMVGSLALSGVLSLNVLERRREIGVLRAIGASSKVILGIFIGEGLILGWLSWLIALPLSIPAGWLMVRGLSAALGGELVYQYTPTGALIWLGIITILAIAASGLPARAASRISVRESLVYE